MVASAACEFDAQAKQDGRIGKCVLTTSLANGAGIPRYLLVQPSRQRALGRACQVVAYLPYAVPTAWRTRAADAAASCAVFAPDGQGQPQPQNAIASQASAVRRGERKPRNPFPVTSALM